MLVLEYKAKAYRKQYQAIDEAIRTVQFIRNKAIRYWMDAPQDAEINRFALNKYSTELRNEFSFVKDLNSMAVQASAERGWVAISRFYDNCKSNKPGKKGYPKFQKDNRRLRHGAERLQLSIKLAVGHCIRQKDVSPLQIQKGLVNSNCWENGIFTPIRLSPLNGLD